jgi:hypothetical protein
MMKNNLLAHISTIHSNPSVLDTPPATDDTSSTSKILNLKAIPCTIEHVRKPHFICTTEDIIQQLFSTIQSLQVNGDLDLKSLVTVQVCIELGLLKDY